jgi:hypothetical protein
MATCDVKELMEDARCFMCLGPRELDAVEAQLLCDLRYSIQREAGRVDFTTSFTGTDGVDLSYPLETVGVNALPEFKSNRADDPDDTDRYAVLDGVEFTDGFVQAEVWKSGGAGGGVSLFGRYTDSNNFYAATLAEPTNKLSITRTKGGVYSLIATGISITFVDGAVFKFGFNGSVLTLTYNGTVVYTLTDTNPITDTAQAGFALFGMAIDNFSCSGVV